MRIPADDSPKSPVGQGLARPPKLVVKQSRFLPLFPFTSWTPKPGAWAGMGRIIVSAALLDCSADRRQYLLAHELGHIAERHSRRGLRIVLAVTVSGSLSFFRDYLPKSIKIIDAAAFICASAYMLYSIGSYRVELEADAVASSLIGVDAVERGIHEMAIVEGSLTKKRHVWALLSHGQRTSTCRGVRGRANGDEAAYVAAYNASP
jgi:Zn-dependent protease with chaperone function